MPDANTALQRDRPDRPGVHSFRNRSGLAYHCSLPVSSGVMVVHELSAVLAGQLLSGLAVG